MKLYIEAALEIPASDKNAETGVCLNWGIAMGLLWIQGSLLLNSKIYIIVYIFIYVA